MLIDNSLGKYEEVLGTASKEIQAFADAIHGFIVNFDKSVCIVPRTGEKSVSYGIGTKKMSESYCYIMPQKDYLNLGFPHGTELDDPNLILEGTGKKYRHIKVRTIADAKSAAVRELIRVARTNRINKAGQEQ